MKVDTHPHIVAADIDRWKSNTEKFLPVFIADIKAGKTQGGRRYFQLFEEYRKQACVQYLEGAEPEDVLRMLLKAAKAFQRMLTSPDLSPGYVTFVDYEVLLYPVLAGDMDTARQLAADYAPRAPGANDSKYHVAKSQALKSALLGNQPAAVAALDQLSQEDEFPGTRASTELMRLVLAGAADIDGAVRAATEEFHKLCAGELAGMPQSALFIEGLGLVRLYGLLHGAEASLTFEDSVLPVELLEPARAVKVDLGL
ncbi:MAG: hypothetical protein H7A21_13815 [Spirochaetales bacterium]|nr:hypothetical protein [Leptospiraceae bacterium]MCB9356952.1 hypothetical protein [Calditrichota bacterium]MCP5482508.1 hypothetical protein [Spirochaetales bacterium]MCP5485789.1 hypothetical protein [Spirochaetales bacterium]